jgi:hypothetical protein
MIINVLKRPGLESFHPGFQYLVSFVYQICVVKSNVNLNVAFNIRFFTLIFVFNAKIYFVIC